MNGVPRLIYVTDRRTARRPLPEMAAAAIEGGVDVLQIREKDLEESALRRLVTSVLDAIGDPTKITLNGAPSIAAELGLGLHLPEAMPLPDHAIRPLSRSTHSLVGARRSANVDYLIAGHVFGTNSKPGLDPLGVDRLAGIAAAAPAPVIAIGGITPDRVREVMAAGAFGIAVLSGINAAEDPGLAASHYKRALERSMESVSNSVPVTVNGKAATITPGITIEDFLKERGHHERMVVVELNGTIVRRAGFATTSLSSGDRIEIVHFVGGG
jgi:thiamine biosynthesis protein ThiS